MLNVTQQITFRGYSAINKTTCISMLGQIDVETPENLRLTHSVVNGDLYRDNQDECDKDIAEFDALVLAAQAELEETDAKAANEE